MGFSVMFSNAARRRVIAQAITCGLLLMVSSSCRIPGLRKAQPGRPLPKAFNGTTDQETSAQLTVEEFYQDPVLTGMVAQALAGNQELKMLEQDIQIASNVILSRRGFYLPFVHLRGGAGVDKHSLFTPLGAAEDQLTYPGGGHFPSAPGNFFLGADFLWRIDIWREYRNARDAARQRYVATVQRRNFFVTQMVADIAENYFKLMMLDQRLLILDQTIALREKSLAFSQASLKAGRGTALAVQRFQAAVRKNQSEKLIVRQEIIETENRINFLLGRYPQSVQRASQNFVDRNMHALRVGVPAQLLRYRTDIRQAERELAANGLDVLVARARFFPKLDITGSVGVEAFDPRYIFDPEAVAANAAGQLVAPFINRAAIKADYLSANAEQLQAVYNYQRTILNAFTEVVNNMAAAENYRRSVEIKKLQLAALRTSVGVANNLFQSDRAGYLDVLFAQSALLEARTVLVETKLEQLSAIVDAYQALGGGVVLSTSTQYPGAQYRPPLEPEEVPLPEPQPEEVPPPKGQPGEVPQPPQPAEAPQPPQPGEVPPPGPRAEGALFDPPAPRAEQAPLFSRSRRPAAKDPRHGGPPRLQRLPRSAPPAAKGASS
jgi:NodT family efflux transporter outer membrane factor (OMF) lipoprotein